MHNAVVNELPITLDMTPHSAGDIEFEIEDRGQVGDVGDLMWVRERHRFRGGDYAEFDERESDGIEWYRVYYYDGEIQCMSSDPMHVPSDFYPDDYHEITETNDMEDGVTGYLTPILEASEMPRWASRRTICITDVQPAVDGRSWKVRCQIIENNIDNQNILEATQPSGPSMDR